MEAKGCFMRDHCCFNHPSWLHRIIFSPTGSASDWISHLEKLTLSDALTWGKRATKQKAHHFKIGMFKRGVIKKYHRVIQFHIFIKSGLITVTYFLSSDYDIICSDPALSARCLIPVSLPLCCAAAKTICFCFNKSDQSSYQTQPTKANSCWVIVLGKWSGCGPDGMANIANTLFYRRPWARRFNERDRDTLSETR